MPLMQKMMEDSRGRLAVQMVIVYFRHVAKVPEAKLRMALQDVYEPVLDPELSALWDRYEEGRTIARRAERRGRVKGKREGIVEGKRLGQLELLQCQLSQRFGPLPAKALAHLQQATLQDLEGIQLRVLTAATLDEALGLAAK